MEEEEEEEEGRTEGVLLPEEDSEDEVSTDEEAVREGGSDEGGEKKSIEDNWKSTEGMTCNTEEEERRLDASKTAVINKIKTKRSLTATLEEVTSPQVGFTLNNKPKN